MMKRSPNLMDAHLPGISGSIYGKNSGSASPIYDENSVVKMGNKSLASLNTLSPPKSAASDSSSGGHNYYQRKSPNASLAPVTPLHPLPIASTDWVDGAKESHQDVSWNSASPTKHHNRALVGDDDLFSHHHHGMTPLQPLSSGGGMLMGPDHPIFSSDGQRGTEAFLPGGVRGARYDPLMPPVSTGTGLDAGMLGGDGMTRPPKGRGPHKLQPGEPNPDHLKPPSWNQGPGFI